MLKTSRMFFLPVQICLRCTTYHYDTTLLEKQSTQRYVKKEDSNAKIYCNKSEFVCNEGHKEY